MQQHDVERIARAALTELGVGHAELSVVPDQQPGSWSIAIRGAGGGPSTLKVRCGPGTTAQWVREQIVTQYTQ